MMSYQFCYFGTPSNAKTWFNVVAFGLLTGVLVPFIYKAGQKLIEASAEKVVGILEALINKDS